MAQSIEMMIILLAMISGCPLDSKEPLAERRVRGPVPAACVLSGPESTTPWERATANDVSPELDGLPFCGIVAGDFDADGTVDHALL